MNKIIIIGILLFFFGFISVFVLQNLFSTKGPMGFPTPNVTFGYLGILMIIIGAIVTFYGRYKLTVGKREEIQKKQKEGKGILVSTTDTILGKKIVKMLGPIQARNNPFSFTLDIAGNAQEYLEKEAERLGANAIVGMKIERQREKKHTAYFAYGTAVIVEDEK